MVAIKNARPADCRCRLAPDGLTPHRRLTRRIGRVQVAGDVHPHSSRSIRVGFLRGSDDILARRRLLGVAVRVDRHGIACIHVAFGEDVHEAFFYDIENVVLVNVERGAVGVVGGRSDSACRVGLSSHVGANQGRGVLKAMPALARARERPLPAKRA